jgi:hypothetical protein
METEIIEKKLPSRTIAKSGRDIFSSEKELTVVMVPYENFSSFSRAIGYLHRTLKFPFNLLVVEGNAPGEVRAELEKWQHRCGNVSVIYSPAPLSLGAAYNLAVPHIKTPYAFFLDNATRPAPGLVASLLHRAMETRADVIGPEHSRVEPFLRDAAGGPANRIQTLGIRPCFLASAAALQALAPFEDELNPFALSVDISMRAREKRLTIESCEGGATDALCVPQAADRILSRFHWNIDRMVYSVKHLEQRWNLSPGPDAYSRWLASKTEETPAVSRTSVKRVRSLAMRAAEIFKFPLTVQS